MSSFYIIPKEKYDEVASQYGQDWPCSEYQKVAPVKIHSGAYANSYAVNVAFLDGEPSKEKYRSILESCVIQTISSADLVSSEE